jgi:hypothetical protein
VELILNLVWALVVTAALALWSVTHSRAKGAYGRQLLAMAMLLVILFPAISITDDLWAVRCPAETDVLVRRYDGVPHHHGIVPGGAHALPATQFRPPDMLVLGEAAVPRPEYSFHEASSRFNLFIRPPPAL